MPGTTKSVSPNRLCKGLQTLCVKKQGTFQIIATQCSQVYSHPNPDMFESELDPFLQSALVHVTSLPVPTNTIHF